MEARLKKDGGGDRQEDLIESPIGPTEKIRFRSNAWGQLKTA
jgi:hypothetical protein